MMYITIINLILIWGTTLILGIFNINFKLNKSEMIFLMGPTGSGKSTLLKTIYKELDIDSGEIFIDNKEISNLRNNEIPFLRRKIGMIFQDYNLLTDRNVIENVALPLYMEGIKRIEIYERVLLILDELGLKETEKKMPWELSGGEQQRVCVARALVKNPEVILADEPTGNLDAIAALELVQLLEEVNKEGTTVLMASHNYNLIKNRSHRILELQNGVIQ